jgi:L-lactate dehydrogenase complex protein LldG
MTGREEILGRIREALRIAAPHPGAHGHGPPTALVPANGAKNGKPPVLPDATDWLPSVPVDIEGRIELFRRNAIDLKASFEVFEGASQAHAFLSKLAKDEDWRRIASHRGELTNAACAALGGPALLTDGGYEATALESCDVGITECEVLIAQTGSVLVTSRSSGGRVLSALPPHHVVLARRDQLLPDLPGAFAFLRHKYAPDYPSLISVITGPSRTGDIERILVLGAHGPRKLTICCW